MTCSDDGTVRMWDMWELKQHTVIRPQLSKPGRVSVTACAYNTDGRLIAAKSLSATPMNGDAADLMLLQQASTGPAAATPLGLTPVSAPPPWSPLVVRGSSQAIWPKLSHSSFT